MDDRFLNRFGLGLARLQSIGHCPVRGGAEAGAEEATDVDVAGERVTPEELETIRNDRRWRQRNEERAAELKRDRDALEHERELLRERERQMEAERTRYLTPEEKKDDGLTLPELPESVIDDPDGFRRTVDARESALLREVRQLRTELGELRTNVTASERAVDTKVNRTVEQERVVAHNNRLFDDFKAKHPDLSDKELQDIREEAQWRGRGPGRGRQVGNVWEYTPEAFDDSYWVKHRDKILAREREEAENRGLRNRARTSGGGFRLGSNGVPNAKSTVEEQANYYYSQGEYSPEAERFIEAIASDPELGPDRVQRIMAYAVDRAQEELGGEVRG